MGWALSAPRAASSLLMFVVSTDMRQARNTQGERLFSRDDWLSQNQIKSFFSRYSRSRREAGNKCLTLSEFEEQNYDRDDEEEKLLREQLTEDIRQSINVCHPIFYDVYNLCDLFSKQKLSAFKVVMLKQICGHFELTIKRKAKKVDLVNVLSEMIKSCECSAGYVD